MWSKWIFFIGFLCVGGAYGIADLRPTLLADKADPLDIIPEELFGLPLNIESIEEERWRPQARSLLEPRRYDGVQGRGAGRPVRYTGEKVCDGACITSRSCEYHQGSTKGHCSNGNVCCVFHKTCGGISREKVSYFRSPMFPLSVNTSLECSYRVYPTEDICALRIDFDRFELKKPKRFSKMEKCVDDMMFLMNSAGGPTEGVCEMENHTAVVEIHPNASHPIIILFVTQSASVSWNLKITHVNCQKMKPWKNVPECGRQLLFEPNEYDSDGQLSLMENTFLHSRPVLSVGNHQNGEPAPHPHPQPYIVNGKDTEKKEFPWQVSLQIKSKSSHRCGGSIINERYILTAAHCVYRNAYASKNKLKVVVGDYDLDDEDDMESEEFDIEKIIVHYNYMPTESHANDIAVIKLNGTIKFNENVQPICLVDKDFNVYSKNAIVSGWGRLNASDPAAVADKLQKLNVKIIPNEDCKILVKREYEEVVKRNLSYEDVARSSSMGVSETQICGLSKNSTSVCYGDSGGPLVIQSEDDGRYFQAGVVSYGLGKCRTDRQIPGSYTNVQKYLRFIAVATMED